MLGSQSIKTKMKHTKKKSDPVVREASLRLIRAIALAEELTFLLWQRHRRSFGSLASRKMFESQGEDIKAAYRPGAKDAMMLVMQAQANIDKRARSTTK